jgi:glucose-1-phosphate thymidylyltransferase
MTALILAAGYGTRMRSVHPNLPKPLLPVAGRPVIDYLLDQLTAIPALGRLVLVTNALFHGLFVEWARARGLDDLRILSDGTRSNEERLGAIGDLQFALEAAAISDDLLVAGADNIFRFELRLLVDYFAERQADVIAVIRERDPERLARTSTLRLDGTGRVTDFVEKAAQPISDLVCPPLYLFRADTLPLVAEYLVGRNPPDAPGNFIAWLHTRRPVYGRVMPAGRHDIGSPETYREAQDALEGA